MFLLMLVIEGIKLSRLVFISRVFNPPFISNFIVGK
jgi:hypothetical protein